MAQTQPRKLFVNVPVADLKRSMDFFSALGFTFNPKFTDDNAACMVVNEGAYFMLLTDPYFKTFTKRERCQAATHSEALFAVSCDGRGDVDEFVSQAFARGATPAMDSQDHGFMYVRSFYDLDGHHWEVFWMDPAAAQ